MITVGNITTAGIRCGLSLFMICADNWLDPPNPVTLKLTSNATFPLKVGQLVQFNCTANNYTGTLAFYRTVGNTEMREKAGYSVFSHTISLTEDDHGTEWYCGTWFSSTVGGHYEYFYTKSNKFSIQLEGVTKVAKPPNREGENVRLKLVPSAQVYHASEKISWLCEAENIQYGFMEMRQAKGNLERKIYVSYQITGSYRWINQYFKSKDNESYIYCTIYIYDWERRIGYSINGAPKYIKLIT